MRLSVLVYDGFVIKDGQGFGGLDLSFMPANVRAFQWYDTFGEIEFKPEIADGQIVTPNNEVVMSEPAWFSQVLAAWDLGNSAFLQLQARLAYELENPQPTLQ